MHYTLKHLRYIEAADREGSITAAAEAMSVSASSIAAAIDMVEAQLGRPIFDRHPSRGVVATRHGSQFIDELRHLLTAQARFDRRVRDMDRALTGTVRLTCFASLGPIMLPTILSEVRDLYPNLTVQIIEGSSEEIHESVASGHADFAIGYDGLMPSSLQHLPLFTAHPHVALPSTHRLAGLPFVRLEELVEEPMVMLDHKPSRDYFMRLFAARDLRPTVAYSARTTDTMRGLIAAGLAYGLFNVRPLTKQSYGQGDLVRLPLAGEHEAPRAGVIHRAEVEFEPEVRAIIRACRAQAASGTFDRAIIRTVDPPAADQGGPSK